MNYYFEDFKIYNKDNKKIVGKIYIPEGEHKTYPVAIFAHGFGSNYRELEHYGPRFASEGIILVLFDFCGGGNESLSDGLTTEMSVLTEMHDYLSVINYLKGIDKASSIYLMGESQGGYVASLVASRYPEISNGLILWYPTFCIGDDEKNRAKDGIKDEKELWGMRLGKIYTVDAINTDIYGEISSYDKSVLIIHGTNDKVVDIEYSRKALNVFKNANLVEIDGAGHGFDGDDSLNAGNLSINHIKGIEHTHL